MSIASTTTTTFNASPNNRSLATTTNQHPHQPPTSFSTEHFVNERYPKTCFEDIPSIMLEYPPPKVGIHPTRSRHSLHFHTQPVTLTEINETEEDNRSENDHQQESEAKTLEDFQRLEHLALSENRRRIARKKLPLKNYLERQRLKAMREESSETDGN